MRQIEKPELISTIRDKKKIWLNIRESRLMYMFHRKLISIEEYEAGSRYRLMCELMGGGTGNVMKERIDGSSTDFITSSLGAALAVKDCDEEIGKLIDLDKERSIDVIITRLRKKIESNPKNPKFLQTIRGTGYVLWIE